MALGLPAGAFAWADQHRQAPDVIPLAVGDVAEVSGAPIGCIVRFHNGERALDCRRGGPLRGTYGTLLTPNEVLVVRFASGNTARIVFQARHERLRVRTCGG